MPKIIALIPARGGSKSIPLKNIKLLGGMPLIYWTLKAACECELIDEVYLATESSVIADTAVSLQLNKVNIFRRSPDTAHDSSPTESVMLEIIERLNFDPDNLIVLLQATSPFTTKEDLTGAILKLQTTGCSSLLSVTAFKRFLWNENGVAINYDYRNRPRRQDYHGSYLENGAFYIAKVKDIVKYKNRLNNKIALYEMPAHTSLELDEPEDWDIAEQILKAHTTT